MGEELRGIKTNCTIMEKKDKFRITATIFGNDIECGFDMPEGLDWDDYEVLFLNRFKKSIEAFGQAMKKLKK